MTTFNGRIEATHVPMFANKDLTVLTGHLAKANPLSRALAEQEVLVLFQGPHCYISPSYYESANTHVPTWNYMAAHFYGRAKMIEDAAGLKTILDKLIDKFEPKNSPWRQDYEDRDVQGMLKAIVGFEITVTRFEWKSKINQNRTAIERESVIRHLQSLSDENSREIARAIINNEGKSS